MIRIRKAEMLQNKYKKLWSDVYNSVIEDMSGAVKTAAHNAAFSACFAVYKQKLINTGAIDSVTKKRNKK